MRIIPAIDIIDGKCVRLSAGDYATKKVYNENPVEVAKAFEDSGIENLHLIDLDGAKSDQIVNHSVLYDIARNTDLAIDFGGGIKSTAAVEIAFENGATQITGGSIAVKNPVIFQGWLTKYGADKIILGADNKRGKVVTNGWLEATQMEVIDFIDAYAIKGIEYVICTDIEKDGMLKGSANGLYTEILEKCPVKLIASGGVSCLEDLIQLKALGCEGAIIGKAIYENKISLKELSKLC